MSLVNWMIDSMASEDVIDLYFILTDLVDLNISEAEMNESSCYDSLASATVREHQRDHKVPLGKLVL